MLVKKNNNYNVAGNKHGYWYSFDNTSINRNIYYKCFYVDGLEVGYEELRHNLEFTKKYYLK